MRSTTHLPAGTSQSSVPSGAHLRRQIDDVACGDGLAGGHGGRGRRCWLDHVGEARLLLPHVTRGARESSSSAMSNCRTGGSGRSARPSGFGRRGARTRRDTTARGVGQRIGADREPPNAWLGAGQRRRASPRSRRPGWPATCPAERGGRRTSSRPARHRDGERPRAERLRELELDPGGLALRGDGQAHRRFEASPSISAAASMSPRCDVTRGCSVRHPHFLCGHAVGEHLRVGVVRRDRGTRRRRRHRLRAGQVRRRRELEVRRDGHVLERAR